MLKATSLKKPFTFIFGWQCVNYLFDPWNTIHNPTCVVTNSKDLQLQQNVIYQRMETTRKMGGWPSTERLSWLYKQSWKTYHCNYDSLKLVSIYVQFSTVSKGSQSCSSIIDFDQDSILFHFRVSQKVEVIIVN